MVGSGCAGARLTRGGASSHQAPTTAAARSAAASSCVSGVHCAGWRATLCHRAETLPSLCGVEVECVAQGSIGHGVFFLPVCVYTLASSLLLLSCSLTLCRQPRPLSCGQMNVSWVHCSALVASAVTGDSKSLQIKKSDHFCCSAKAMHGGCKCTSCDVWVGGVVLQWANGDAVSSSNYKPHARRTSHSVILIFFDWRRSS